VLYLRHQILHVVTLRYVHTEPEHVQFLLRLNMDRLLPTRDPLHLHPYLPLLVRVH
jgi:hypothetical protein